MSFALKRPTSWAPRGHEIAWEQWPLTLPAPPPASAGGALPAGYGAAPSNPLWIAEDGTFLRITGREFAFVFDRLNGVLLSYSYRGVKLLERGPLPDFWRAPTGQRRRSMEGARQRRADGPGPRHLRLEDRRAGVEGHRRATEAR